MEAYSKKRSYEISLWTLQDSFIAVLGDSSSQTKGYIENPQISLSNDGTQELDFSLPMYIDDGITRKRNNIWEYMTEAVTIAGMRKIKVIFNKGTDVEAVYEFIITRVVDTHENNRPMCEIHCEGLAFHELGKIGYKIELSEEVFNADVDEAWLKSVSYNSDPESDPETDPDTDDEDSDSNENSDTEPQSESDIEPEDNPDEESTQGEVIVNNIDYWCQKVGLTKFEENTTLNASIWYYRVKMDWSGFEGSNNREEDMIYEESYASAYDEDTLDAISYSRYQEKYRIVSSSNSNVYNLTQEIAKVFGVYCKYEYVHDDNYHIIGRIVTFYNNFFDEQNRLEFTYPYTANRITRENDCTDLVTKMYVNTIETDQSETGLVTIMNNPVNPTGEDYLLNFDYLYAIGTITDEQYAYVKEFSIAMNKINKRIFECQEFQVRRDTVENILNAQLAVLNNTIVEDQQQLESYDEKLQDLAGEDGIITRTGATRVELMVVNGIVTYNDGGIIYENIDEDNYSPKLYYNDTLIAKGKVEHRIKAGYVESSIIKQDGVNRVLAEYKYHPSLYYEQVKNTYEDRLQRDIIKRDKLQEKIESLENEAENYSDLSEQLRKKQVLLKQFEQTMGPALREGNWTPEDYINAASASYQFLHTITWSATSWTNDSVKIIGKGTRGPSASLIWDPILSYDEQDNHYEELDGSYKYYYFLQLNSNDMKEIAAFYNDQQNANKPYGLVWYDPDYSSPTSASPSPIVKSLMFGAGCELIFINISDNQIRPAILLTDYTESFHNEWRNGSHSNSKLYLCTITLDNNKIACSNCLTGETLNEPYEFTKSRVNEGTNQIVHQLRFRIEDYTLYTDSSNLKIKYNDTNLVEYEDYSILPIMQFNSGVFNSGYDITFKPLSVLKLWTSGGRLQINYNCSQLSTQVYLDAVQVLKENAYPKVTYSLDPNLIYEDFFYTDYNSLNKIAFINDYELEFNEVQGYISSIQLNLDKPWEDSIEVKNYKNKFEDIFSTIVASSDSMQKNEAFISSVGNVVNIDGTIATNQIQSVLANTTLKYPLSNGILTIGKADGILTSGELGAIQLRPNGLMIASSTSENGNWAWQSAITPQGINASAITYGNLNIVNANLGNGALIVRDKSFTLTSNKLNLNSDDCTFNLSGTHITLKSNEGVFILDGGKIDINSSNGDFILDNNKININTNTGDIIFNNGNILSINYNTGLISTHTETINEITNQKGNITLANGILQSNEITQNNGQNISTPKVSLQDGILSVASENNLRIGSGNIKNYVETIISDSTGSPSEWIWSIPIARVSIGRSSNNRTVYVTDNSLRLGTGSNPIFLYENSNITTLGLGQIFEYTVTNNIESASLAGWTLSATNGLISSNNSKLSPTDFNLNDYLKVNSNGIEIKEIKLTKELSNEHIITFINNGENELNYLLKINSNGMFYSLDNGNIWYQLAIISNEPEPEPEPNPEPDSP